VVKEGSLDKFPRAAGSNLKERECKKRRGDLDSDKGDAAKKEGRRVKSQPGEGILQGRDGDEKFLFKGTG